MYNNRIILKGITWNHTRGYLPMVATGQRYSEIHPDVEIVWEKRSLQAFADASLTQLALAYDLLVIDHPWVGVAAQTKALLPLDEYIDYDYMEDQQHHSVGKSHISYHYDQHQWALAIDAATPVASSRPDLLERYGKSLPATFDAILALAQDGLVGMPLIPIDTLMAFYMFCCTLGENPCTGHSKMVGEATGTEGLKLFGALAAKLDRRFFDMDPIKVYETMANTDTVTYCPFAYGYSNYAREGYGGKPLHFHDVATLKTGRPFITTLGGAGLAISAHCSHIEQAIAYAKYVASPSSQSTLYIDAGGQPGHSAAWHSPHANGSTNGYFKATLPALHRAFLRPRNVGHIHFQHQAGDYIRQYLMEGGDERAVLGQVNELYRKSMSEEVYG